MAFINRLAVSIRSTLNRRCDLLPARSDRLVERIKLAAKRTQRPAAAVGN